MSKAKHYWYHAVKRVIINPCLLDRESEEHKQRMLNAIKEALEEVKELPNGDLQYKAVHEVLIAGIKSPEMEAMDMNYDVWTINKWLTGFVHRVGRKAGY